MDVVTLIAYWIAVAIPAFVVYLFWAQDVFGTGKLETIVASLAWGAVGAFALAYVINTAVIKSGVAYDTVTGLTAPILEEMLKALVLIVLVQQPRFRYLVDGAVYGIAVGIGFGLSENVFIYIPGSDDAVLGTAIIRTLSTALMHAAASGMVGITLGRRRRMTGPGRQGVLLIGFGTAIGLHIFYNNVVGQLSGMQLLAVAIVIGFVSSIAIAWQVQQGLKNEKARFSSTLNLQVGVGTEERGAIQRLGGSAIEAIFDELEEQFGTKQTDEIRRLLALQANMGILRNNLVGSQVSARLRQAWEEEIEECRREFEKIRQALSRSVLLYVQPVLLNTDQATQDALTEELARFDPTLVHTFDMFMRDAGLSVQFTPEQLAAIAERLNKIEIFQHISLANLENLSRGIYEETFAEGTMLFDQGDEGDAMYLIETGQVGIFGRNNPDQPIRTFGPGSVVGEFSLLDGQARSARAQAQSAIKVFRLPRLRFTMFIQSRPQVVLAMLQYLAEKARFTTSQAVETGQFKTAPGAQPAAPAAVGTDLRQVKGETSVESLAAQLAASALFKGVEQADRERLIARMRREVYPAQTILFEQDAPGDAAFIVLSGQVRIFSKGSQGRELTIRHYGPGDMFGEFAVFDKKPRSTAAQAVDKLEVLVLNRDDLVAFLRERPHVGMAIMRELVGRVRYVHELWQ